MDRAHPRNIPASMVFFCMGVLVRFDSNKYPQHVPNIEIRKIIPYLSLLPGIPYLEL